MKNKKVIAITAVAAVAAAVIGYKISNRPQFDTDEFFSGNGRLEATEVNVAAKLAGRIEEIWVNEGDFVTRGQKLALMQLNVLNAEMAQAKARRNKAVSDESSAKADVEVRTSELEAAKAELLRQESRLDGAKKRYDRSKILTAANASSQQSYDDNETNYLTAKAEVASAKAKVKQAEAAINSAKAEAAGAAADIKAAEADMQRIQADIDDSLLTAPREGRIQYRIAEPGEVMAAGGKVLNLVDLTDVYMTFFLPEEVAGKVSLGAEVRLVLDAIPDIPIPAEVSFVASVAQFTPKTVETHSERQKLMFRVKARIRPELLKKHIKLVKTGLPGVAYVQIDPKAQWPDFLTLKKIEAK